MKFIITFTLKLKVTAKSPQQAAFGLERFIKHALLIYNATGGDAIKGKDIVVEDIARESIQEVIT